MSKPGYAKPVVKNIWHNLLSAGSVTRLLSRFNPYLCYQIDLKVHPPTFLGFCATGSAFSLMSVNFNKVASGKYEFHLSVQRDKQLVVDMLKDAFVAEGSAVSKQKIKQAMQKGCVWLEKTSQQGKPFIQRLRRARKSLQIGEVLHCYYDEKVLETEPPRAELVSDEGDYSIWNKPSGMLSQGSKWGDHCTINRWAEKHLLPERPAFIVHRLDRAANGLIILAHKKKVAQQFARLFQSRDIEKRYQVSVVGDFSSLNLNSDKGKTISEAIDGKPAISHISFLNYDEKSDSSLLDVHIETGRKHQIRKHLAGLGFPVIGDRLYGNDTAKEQPLDLQLSSVLLRFNCPVSGQKKCYSIL